MPTVALVTSSFLPRFGGVEEHVLNVARGLRRRGVNVVVWAVDQGDEVPSDIEGIPVRYLPCPMPARSLGALAGFTRKFPRAVQAWHRAARRDRPDVVHVHCYGPNGPWATALAALTRCSLVVSAHGETFMDAGDLFGRSAIQRASLAWSLRRAAAVTGCSGYVLADLRTRFGLRPTCGTVVPNGIELDEPAGKTPAGHPDKFVLAIGRVVPTKGFDLLIDAFAKIDSAPGVRLVIGGDGPELDSLKRHAADRGVADRTVFAGRMTRGQVVAVARAAAVFVVPSRVEAFGIVVLEGWRGGAPVVATTRGGPPEFIADGEDGLLVDPTDADALASTIDTLLGDQELAARIGSAGRRSVEHYTWERVVDSYLDLYRQSARV